MKFKLDENISRHLRARLLQSGLDVESVESEGLLSQPDDVVAAAAKAEGRILLTLDIGLADVRKYPPGTHPGIVLFRLPTDREGAQSVSDFVEHLLKTADWKSYSGCLVVVEQDSIRIRRDKP